ncbi:MAG: hypothetical protein ACAF41_26975 [Leptolyngbya sp. BL-A-14]
MAIIISYLPLSTAEAAVKQLFQPYGNVQVNWVQQAVWVQIEGGDRQTELQAIEALQQTKLDGHLLQFQLVDDTAPDIAFPVNADLPSGGSSSSGRSSR